jgi:hypothetical protein
MVTMSRKANNKSVTEVNAPVSTGAFDLDNSFDIGIIKPEYLEPVTVELVSTPIKFIVDFGSFLTHDYLVNKEVKLVQMANAKNENLTFLEKRFKSTVDYFVQNALIGWENAKRNGEDIPFSKELALDYFKTRPNIYTELETRCLTILIELTQKRDSDIKN